MKVAASVMLMAVLLFSTVPPYNASAQGDSVRIDGAGASFVFPLMDLWRVKYAEIHPDVQMNYQSIGSGGGVKQHIEKTVDFAASDAPLRESEYDLAPGTITIPVVIGAISLAYDVPGIDSGINITAEALCQMHLGTVVSWNDPMIADANPGLEIPDQDIVIVHRSDGSGTTFAFTSYLSKVCPEWDEKVGAGKSVPWPIGVGAAGNEGVAGVVSTTPGSIGYVTLAYAFQNDLAIAALENRDGTNFVLPTLESAADASRGVACSHTSGDLQVQCLEDTSDPWNIVHDHFSHAGLPHASDSWTGVDLLAALGENSYPITSFSYILLHPDLKGSANDYDHAVEIVNLIAWIITDGQEYNNDLRYVNIPAPVANLGLEGLAAVTYDGQSVLTISDDHDDDYPDDHDDKIPEWIQIVFKLYGDGLISDDELIAAITFLVEQDIIKLDLH